MDGIKQNSAIICCNVMAKVIEKLKTRNQIEREISVLPMPSFTDFGSFLENLELLLGEIAVKFKEVRLVSNIVLPDLDLILNKYGVKQTSPLHYFELLLGSEDQLAEALKTEQQPSQQEILELKNLVWSLVKNSHSIGLALKESARQHEMILAQNKHQQDLIRQLNKISQIVTSSLNIDDIYSAFAQEVKTLVDYDRMSIATVDETGKNLVVFALAQDQVSSLGRGKVIPLEGTAPAWVIRSGIPSIAGDLQQERQFIEEEALAREGFRSALRVPLISKGKTFGTLNLNSYAPYKYGAGEAEILQQVAAQVATAIDNAWLFAETERKNLQIEERNRRLAILNDISRVVSQSLDLKAILEEALAKIIEFVGRRCGTVYLLDEDSKELKMFAQKNLPAAVLEQGQRLPLDEGEWVQVLRTGKPLIVENVEKAPAPGKNICTLAGVKSVVYIPLKAKNKILGVIVSGDSAESKITQEDIELLMAIGNQVGVAVENAQLYQQLKHLAEFDDLTGLLNRRIFYQIFRKELKRAVRYRQSLALLMIDVDYFKKYNDTFGHLAGDQALKKLGQALKEAVRETDIPARYGGEEFVVLLLEADKEKAVEVAYRIQNHIKVKAAKCPLPTVSIGIAAYPRDGSSVEKLIFCADDALYQAKNGGRNRVVFYSGT